ncbi:DUF3038 domain-containing protein [Prochlorothrix hollandica]|uniref:DUF3038 domain-containing protein n=1 Tax=Prochlorothrix hollandica TaxID=1223 RepID=UPI0033415954
MSTVVPFPQSPTLQALPPVPTSPAQLHNIKAQLDLILLALEALTGIGSEAMVQAADTLQLSGMGDRVSLWRLRQANPLRKGQGGRKKLDVEEAKALVLLICYLAQQHQTRIRSAVGLLEQLTSQGRPPHEAAVLGDYLDGFCNLFQDRMDDQSQESLSMEHLSNLALKLLIDLLFYGGSGGARRLWVALIDRSAPS